MSLSVVKGDGFTVVTMSSNPGSKCPVVCDVFAALCCSPACKVSGKLRKRMAGTQLALATIQIMAGLLTLGLGALLLSVYLGPFYMRTVYPPYWSGALFIVSGILCIFAERFSSRCLVSATVAVNLASAAVAIAVIGLYAADDGPRLADACLSFEPSDKLGERTRAEENFRLCQMYKRSTQPIVIGLKVLLMAFAALLICVNIVVAVLGIRALTKKSEGQEAVPDVQQPLLEEEAANPVA